MKEVSKRNWSQKERNFLPEKSKRLTVKRQKMEEETEKEDLKGYLDIVLREEFAEDVESSIYKLSNCYSKKDIVLQGQKDMI
ncbi:hypothetical protein Tco_0921687 [Tanacetum coccineum]